MTDSRSAWEIFPHDACAAIDIAHAAAFFFGRRIESVMSFEGLGKFPFKPRNVSLVPSSVFATFSLIPRVSQKLSKVLRALSHSLAGTRAPKSSKYASSGIPNILLNITEMSLEKQL